MDLPGGDSAKKAVVVLGAVIVIGGFALAFAQGSFTLAKPSSATPDSTYSPVAAVNGTYVVNAGVDYGSAALNIGGSTPTDSTRAIASTTFTTTATSYGTSPDQSENTVNGTGGNTLGSGSLLEFSSDLTIQVKSPEDAASSIAALAYSVGGYVAYQSTAAESAYVVIRVPASEYQSALAQVRQMGTLVNLVSNSNDVTVQYTDLNATLASLTTEENSLLSLLKQSTSINSTLAIESQLQQVDQQIDSTESQILQTKTLVEYSTIDVTLNLAPQSATLSMVLKAAPENGTAPLAVTFEAIVKGGAPPYVVNYNFGDGTSYEGQALIHTYYKSGTYKVTVTATDQNGTVAIATATVKVESAPSTPGFVTFFGSVANLFIGVVEGIVEVAVVVIPVVLVAGMVVIPLKRRFWPSKQTKPTQ